MGVRITTLFVKFALSLFIAKFLTLESLGWFGLVASAGIAASPIFGLGCMQVLSRTSVQAESKELVAPISYYLIYVLCLYSVLLAVLLLLGLGSPLLVVLIWGVVLMEHLGTDNYQLLVCRARPLWANFMHFCRGGLWGLVYMPLAYAIPELRNLETIFMFWILGGATDFAGTFLTLRKWPWGQAPLKLRDGTRWLINQARTARPLYISSVCETLTVHSDRFIITALLGPAVTGIYVFFLQIGSALANLHFSGVVQMSRPAFVRTAAEKVQSLPRLLWSTARIAVVSTLVFSTAALIALDYLLPLVGKEALTEWKVIFYFVLVWFNLNVFAELQKQTLFALHADRSILRVTVLRVLVGPALMAALVYFVGLQGAGIALVVQSVFRVMLQYKVIHGRFKQITATTPAK